MAEKKDYAETLFDAVSVLIDKKIESVKFDETIKAVIVDDNRADDGIYTVSTGSVKFTAYSTEVEYKNDDPVLVMIPQGNYDNQKIIIGKQADENESPLIYKSPFQHIVNLSNNLIQGSKEASFWANDDGFFNEEIEPNRWEDLNRGYPWDISIPDFKNSTLYQRVIELEQHPELSAYENEYSDLVLCDISNVFYQGYTRIGISAQFSTWLSDYNTFTGNYGLAIEVTFKCLDADNINNQQDTFTKIITFDSKEFFGDIYNFETYYTQENVYDISDYIDYPITRIRLFAYQRSNFFSGDGTKVPHNLHGQFGTVNPNIFIKEPYLCLGISVNEFEEDQATLMTANSLTYYKGDAKTTNVIQRLNANQKLIGLRWVHKDIENDIIKTVEPNEFPDNYEIRWYRYKLGERSPDQFAGAHWQRLVGYLNPPNPDAENEEDRYPKADADGNYYSSESFLDVFTNNLEIVFLPNVNYSVEKIKAIVIKNEGNDDQPFYRLIAASNILEFTNDTEVRNNASVLDMNALGIKYVTADGAQADCLGNYFLYNKSDEVLNQADKEIRFLQLVFDEQEPNVYEKQALVLDQESDSITWYFPFGNDTMIIPATTADNDAQPIQSANQINEETGESYYVISGKNELVTRAFFIKRNLNRYAGRNTVKVEVIKDGASYSANAEMRFGTAGTSGSDYTIQLYWKNGKEALDVTDLNSDRAILEGEVALFDQSGQRVQLDPENNRWEIDWYLAEKTTLAQDEALQFAMQTSEYYYPIYFNNNYVTFKRGQFNDDRDNTQRTEDKWYYYLLTDVFTDSILSGSGGLSFSNGLNLTIKTNGWPTLYPLFEKIYFYDDTNDSFINCLDFYEQQYPSDSIDNVSGPSSVEHFLLCFSKSLEETNIDYKYRQLYFKKENSGKRALVFEPLKNVYDNNQNDQTFYISSLGENGSDNVFFVNTMESQSKTKFQDMIYEEISQELKAIPKFNTMTKFFNELQKFVEKYYDYIQDVSNNNTEPWKICIGNTQTTLFSIIKNNLIPETNDIYTITLYKILTDNINNLYYYDDNNESYTKINVNNFTESDIDILREFYRLLYNKTNGDLDLNALKQEYFYNILKDPSYWEDDNHNLRTIVLSTEQDYAYSIDGRDIMFIQANTPLDFKTLGNLLDNDGVVFYNIVALNDTDKNNALTTLKENFTNGTSSWEDILCRIINYQEKSLSEINQTRLPVYYLINNESLKDYIYNALSASADSMPYQTVLSNLLNNSNNEFQALVHDEYQLNQCLLKGILRISPDGNNYIVETGDSSPGFQAKSDYESIIEREKPKFFLEQKFKQQNNEIYGAMEILKLLRAQQMNTFTYLKDSSHIQSTTSNDYLTVLASNPTISKTETDEYANILYLLCVALNEAQDTLLEQIEDRCNSENPPLTAPSISNIENHILSSSQNFTDFDYIYGKVLFKVIKEFLNKASSVKKVLQETYNLGMLLKLFYSNTLYDALNTSGFGNSIFDTIEPFFEKATSFTHWDSELYTNVTITTYAYPFLNETVIQNSKTCADQYLNDLSYLGTFRMKDSAKYCTENFLETVTENSINLKSLIKYCAEKAQEDGLLSSVGSGYYIASSSNISYDLFTDEEFSMIPTSLPETEKNIPEVLIDINNKKINYTGCTRYNVIFTSKTDSSQTLTKSIVFRNISNFGTYIANYITQEIGKQLFETSDILSLRNNKNIISFYTYYRSTEISSCPLQHQQVSASTTTNSDGNFVCSINNAIAYPEKDDIECKTTSSSDTFGSIENKMKYKYLCQKYYPRTNLGRYNNFASVFMHILLEIWRQRQIAYEAAHPSSSSCDTGFLNIFGLTNNSYIKEVNATETADQFGYSDEVSLLFFPYNSYNGFKYKSINTVIREKCINTNGTINQENIRKFILEKIGNNDSVMILKDDTNNDFYLMLMKLLFTEHYQNVNAFFKNDEDDENNENNENNEKAIKFLLQLLTSDQNVFWKCFNIISEGFYYPTAHSEGQYSIYSSVTQSLDNTQNIFLNFKNDIQSIWDKRDKSLTLQGQKEELQNSFFDLFKSYFNKVDFYQLSTLDDSDNKMQEKIASYMASLCFKSPLNTNLYLQAFYNNLSDDNSKNSFLNYFYLNQDFDGLQSTENLTALNWLQTILESRKKKPFSHKIKTNLQYYLREEDNMILLTDFIKQSLDSLPLTYLKIIASSLYQLSNGNTEETTKETIVNHLVTVFQETTSLIPKKAFEILKRFIEAYFTSDISSDIELYNSFMGVAFSENSWYYKITDENNAVSLKTLFDNTNKVLIIKEFYKIFNNFVQFYKVNENISAEAPLYFNYYNNLNKKVFVKRNGYFILDPDDSYNPVETYYQPLQSLKKVNKYDLLEIDNGNDQSPIFEIRPKTNTNAETLLNSLHILRVSLVNFGDYKLVACFPIAFKNNTQVEVIGNTVEKIRYQVKYIEGATSVWYPMTNSPEYYQNPYKIFIQRIDIDPETNKEIIINEEKKDVVWEIFYSQGTADNFLPILGDNNVLKPVSVFVKDATNYGIRCYNEQGIILWSQAIYVYQDRYPSTTVNKWNGNDIELNKDKGIILASAFAAGRKEDDNSFSGVMIGDWRKDDAPEELKAQTGIYGFDHGETSYGFRQDGTAFIGKENAGRIHFDGNKSQIYSTNWLGRDNLGLLLDLDDGYIQLQGVNVDYKTYSVTTSGEDGSDSKKSYDITESTSSSENSYITIDSCLNSSDGSTMERHTRASGWAMAIGTRKSESSRELRIGWGGDIHIDKGYLKGSIIESGLIKGSDIVAHYLQADNGWISGWLIKGQQIQSPPGVIRSSDNQKSWTVLHPTRGITTNQINISTESAINVDEDGNPTSVGGYLGYLTGRNDVSETDAIGISSSTNTIITQTTGSASNIGIKAKGSNGSVYVEGNVRVALRYSPIPNSTDSLGKIVVGNKGIILEHTTNDISLTANNNITLSAADKAVEVIVNKDYVKVDSKKIEFTADADQQFGIYARFG